MHDEEDNEEKKALMLMKLVNEGKRLDEKMDVDVEDVAGSPDWRSAHNSAGKCHLEMQNIAKHVLKDFYFFMKKKVKKLSKYEAKLCFVFNSFALTITTLCDDLMHYGTTCLK